MAAIFCGGSETLVRHMFNWGRLITSKRPRKAARCMTLGDKGCLAIDERAELQVQCMGSCKNKRKEVKYNPIEGNTLICASECR